MKNYYHLAALCLMLFSFGCKKHLNQSPLNELKSFKLEAINNPEALDRDVSATIEDHLIKLNLPEEVMAYPLVATFTIEGIRMDIGNIEQISGSTANDFTKSLTYSIVAENGGRSDYEVKINIIEDFGLNFDSFGFHKAENPSLSEDHQAEQIGDTLVVTLRGYTKTLIPYFTTDAKEVKVADVVQVSDSSQQDFAQLVTYTLKSTHDKLKNNIVKVIWKNVPLLTINTTDSVEVTSKEHYLSATIQLEGNGEYPDFNGTTKIRGRGNSTWINPKKPYKLKLTEKASLCGMAAGKKYVLLANYQDPTMMLNAVALKAGLLLDMPYTNHIVPVDLVINGNYKGSYMLTEQITVATGRIDIKSGGTLLELDSYYDEDYKFKSNGYNLPVNIKYPELSSTSEIAPIKAEFQQMEDLVKDSSFPYNNYADYIDLEQLASYLLVTDLVRNTEICHPKSVYMFKVGSGKYMSGPLWDYDWVFGFNGAPYDYFHVPSMTVFSFSAPGSQFYTRFFEDPVFKNIYKQKWNDFKANKMPQLMQYIDEYANTISDSYARNYELWNGGTGDLIGYRNSIKNWLQQRIVYMDGVVASF